MRRWITICSVLGIAAILSLSCAFAQTGEQPQKIAGPEQKTTQARGLSEEKEYSWNVPAQITQYVKEGEDTVLRAELSENEDDHYDLDEDFLFAWYSNPEDDRYFHTDSSFDLYEVEEPQVWFCDVRLADDEESANVKTIQFNVNTTYWTVSTEEDDFYLYEDDDLPSLKVDVTGLKDEDEPTFAWTKTHYEGGKWVTEDLDCVTDTFKGVEYEDARYCAVVTVNGISQKCLFHVETEKNFELEADAKLKTVNYGDPVSFTVTPKSNFELGTVEYAWYEWDEESEDYEVIEGKNSQTLTVDEITTKQQYMAEAHDKHSGCWAYAYLEVNVENHFEVTTEDSDDFQSVTIAPEDDVVLKAYVSADDMTGMSYDWDVDAKAESMSGETTDTLTLHGVKERGSAYCYVTDKFGSTKCIEYYVHLDNEFNAIAEEAVYLTEPNGSATMKVKASVKKGKISYQWSQWTVDPEDEGHLYYKELEGETKDTLAVSGIKKLEKYRCIASDEYGNTQDIYITARPDSGLKMIGTRGSDRSWKYLSVKPEMTADLVVNVKAKNGEPITFQWMKQAEDDEWAEIEGATKDSYTTDAINSNIEYRCVVQDQYGYKVIKYYDISVDSGISLDYGETVFVEPGGDVTLHVDARADKGVKLSYQWIDYNEDPIEGETTDSLKLTNVTERTVYGCRVSDPYGNHTNAWIDVRVDSGLQVDDDYTVPVKPGESVTLNADATANEGVKLCFQWYDDAYDEIEGATAQTLELSDVKKSQEYYCEVSDPYGNEKTAKRYVLVDTGFKSSSKGTRLTVRPGDDQDLTVEATSSEMEKITYSWTRYDYEEEEWTKVDSAQTSADNARSVVALKNINASQRYRCEVEDGYGNSNTFSFQVLVDSGLELEYEDPAPVAAGGSVTLTVTPKSAMSDNAYTYKWYLNEKPIKDADSNKCVLSNVEEAADVDCLVTDKYGCSDWAEFHVAIENNLSVSITPAMEDEKITIKPGQSVTVKAKVTATETKGLTYAWYYKDDNVVSEKDSAQVSKSGWYSLYVTDIYENREYRDFLVKVDSNLIAEADGEDDITVSEGSAATLKVKASSDSDQDLVYRWYNSEYDRIGSDKSKELTFTPKKTSTVYCEVYDGYNKEIVAFEVHVDTGLVLDYAKTVSANQGDPVTLEVKATGGKQGSTIRYQWYEVDEDGDYTTIKDAIKSTYTVPKAHTARYECEVTDGVDTQYAKIKVNVDPATCTHQDLLHTEAKASTCNAEGNTEYWTCRDCGQFFGDATATKSIQEGSWITPVDPAAHKYEAVPGSAVKTSCEKDGKEADMECIHCHNVIKGATIPALGHNWGEWTEVTPATEDQDGVKQHVCSRCEKTEDAKIPKLSHTHVLTKIEAVAPTCMTPGNIEHWYCEECEGHFSDAKGEQQIEENVWKLSPDPDAHSLKTVEGSGVAATCTDPGKEADQECEYCHKTFIGKEISALGHDYAGKVTKKASDKADGVKTYTCQNDPSHTYTEAIPKLNLKAVAVKKTFKVKAKAVKKKNQTIKAPIKVTGAKTKVSYKKAKGKGSFTVNAKNGNVTVKKGTKKGKYKVVVTVKTAASADYSSVSRKVKLSIVVK